MTARSKVQTSDPHRHGVREAGSGRFTRSAPADPPQGDPPADPPPAARKEAPAQPAAPRPASIAGSIWSRGLGALRKRSDG